MMIGEDGTYICITASVPEALVSDANNLAMALAYGPADGLTYGSLGWEDEDGNLYAAASWLASQAWIEATAQPLVRPAWDVDNVIDMAAAERAQDALVFSLEPLTATPSSITAIGGMEGVPALETMGLVRRA